MSARQSGPRWLERRSATLGGVNSATCPAKTWIDGIDNMSGVDSVPNTIALSAGKWLTATWTVPATGFTKLGILGFRLTTFAC